MAAKSIAERLGIKPGADVWLSDGTMSGLCGPLPKGANLVRQVGEAAVAVLFAQSAASLREVLEAERDHLLAPAVLWVAYPKGGRADINRDSLWPIVAEYGMRPIAQVALDETWSALRFRPLGAGEAPFVGGRA